MHAAMAGQTFSWLFFPGKPGFSWDGRVCCPLRGFPAEVHVGMSAARDGLSDAVTGLWQISDSATRADSSLQVKSKSTAITHLGPTHQAETSSTCTAMAHVS